MKRIVHNRVLAVVAALAVVGAPGLAQGRVDAPPAGAVSEPVPLDLRPLLAPRRSEMRLVVNRYSADRNLLIGNYAGGGGGGGGGGGNGRAGGAADSSAAAGGRGAGAPDSAVAGRGAGAGAPPDSTAGGRGAGRGGTGRGAGGGGGGGGAGRGGRGGAPDAGPPLTISRNRIARLKRFDLSWQAALARLDGSKLSAEARTDLDSLKKTVETNLTQLDAEATALNEVSQIIPFATEMVSIIEARIQLADIDAERSAGALTRLTREIGAIHAQLDSGRSASPPSGPGVVSGLRASRAQALRAAGAVESLRNNLSAWFTFYNGYDPLFTWWMGLPYKNIDNALRGYTAFLRDTVAFADQASTLTVTAKPIDAAPAPRLNDVPDLMEIILLPQDELADIVQRFTRGGGRGGGRGGRGGAPDAGRDTQYYNDWLGALKSLDFDKLTRNAQVDYLYIKKFAEIQLARMGTTLPQNPPRKADNTGIPGAARGREGLIRDLQDELIPYSPEQLMALAERELAWCEQEMKKASRQMGFGDDWKAALEKTKQMHVPPGGQPGMIRDLIFESIDFLRAKDLVTVPEVVSESQRMNMMTPERQLVNPFFTGGTLISVSYPTDDMDFDAREQSMRGNNRPWSHATAFHETVPGHNLVGYYSQRFNGYRASLGATGPFFGEGWPLYWELTMYELGFNKTPEERVGALFWRMHRCARIIFSLKFHMGEWSPQEAIDFLVDRIGHERDNATAEVRRSFQGGYGPLYQAAYLLGGLQLRGLRKELVDSKQMTNKAFHDEILRQGSMPIALIRLALTKQKLTRDMSIDWTFYGDLPDR